MKKVYILSSLFVLLLTACSASSARTAIGSTNTDLPIATQLAVGTLKLAGTDQAVTSDQAKELVVYWEAYRDLSQSQTAAQAEIDGLVAQIQETMTTDQIQAIAEMNISQKDVFASVQGVNVTTSNSNASSIKVSSSSSGGAGMPAGVPPADGGGAPPDGGMPSDLGGAASASGTNQAQSTQAGSGLATTSVPSALIEAVIQSLQKVIAA